MFHGHLDYFQKPPLGGRPTRKPGDHRTLSTHNRWFVLFYHVWGPAWIQIHWNSIWLRARSHTASHYTRRYVTTLLDCGGVLGHPLALSFGLSQYHGHILLARVWSGPNSMDCFSCEETQILRRMQENLKFSMNMKITTTSEAVKLG